MGTSLVRQSGMNCATAIPALLYLTGIAVPVLMLAALVWALRGAGQRLRAAESEANELRRQLAHVTRVASLSDFSSTIAHELNQPLTAILANAQAALRFLQHEPPNLREVEGILAEIVEADQRAGQLIRHLRLLMKKGEEQFVELDLNHLVPEVLAFVRGEFLLRAVEVRTSYAPDLPRIVGDRVQLHQVMLNLVCNACEAMQAQERPRVLSVRTLQAPDANVQVIVCDTGPGVPAERVEQIFEPFFTTKGSGLGMGLTICRRIAAAHGGRLTAQSRAGEGARFCLLLPEVRRAPRGARRAERYQASTIT
jgi:two-component system sensor kinase FixL